MDTNFQDLGDCPTQNSSHDLQAGEFAKSTPVSPAEIQGSATFGSLVRITKDYRPEQVGQIGIITAIDYPLSCVLSEREKGITWTCYTVAFSFGSEDYDISEFELLFPSSNSSKDLQLHLISHLKALLVFPAHSLNVPALLFVAAKLHYEDLTNGSKFSRRVAGVFIDRAFEHLKNAAAILSPNEDKNPAVQQNDSIDAKRWRYFRDVVLPEQGFSADPLDFQNAIDESISKFGA